MEFPTTHWALVERARGGAGRTRGDAQPIATAELVRLYAPALRAYLLQSLRYDEHRADDLVQGFLADKVLERHLIGHADPTRGRFRTFLLAALDRYVLDDHRRNTARKRSPRGALLDIDDHRDVLASRHAASAPTHAFDLVWAREVVGEVLVIMREHCLQTDRADLWDVFEVRYLKPAIEGIEPEAHHAIAKRLKLETAHQAASLLVTAKRMFTRVFKSVVARYAASDHEIRDEVTQLWRIFASGRP